MKHQADKGRSEHQFQVGGLVCLKLQPDVQSSLSARANQKLAFKFFGPFKVLQRVGSAAYKLELPSDATIHPVFHVSQLKKAIGVQVVSPDLPPGDTTFQVPESVLERRMSSGDRPVLQGLIKWSGMPAALHWPHERIWTLFVNVFRWRRLRGKSFLKERGMLPVLLLQLMTRWRMQVLKRRVIKPNRKVSGPDWRV